jgi:hypothetical protein
VLQFLSHIERGVGMLRQQSNGNVEAPELDFHASSSSQLGLIGPYLAKVDPNSFLNKEKERNYVLIRLASFGGYIIDKLRSILILPCFSIGWTLLGLSSYFLRFKAKAFTCKREFSLCHPFVKNNIGLAVKFFSIMLSFVSETSPKGI